MAKTRCPLCRQRVGVPELSTEALVEKLKASGGKMDSTPCFQCGEEVSKVYFPEYKSRMRQLHSRLSNKLVQQKVS